MPIYEFYCSDCHALFNFFSARIDTESRPDCPRCGRERLERKPARFAALTGATGSDEDGEFDDARMDQALASMAQDFEQVGNDDDPRAMAGLMRRFGEKAGLEMSPEMEAMVSRLEAGEDPDEVEKDFGDLDDDEAGFEQLFRQRRKGAGTRSARPLVDDELYFL